MAFHLQFLLAKKLPLSVDQVQGKMIVIYMYVFMLLSCMWSNVYCIMYMYVFCQFYTNFWTKSSVFVKLVTKVHTIGGNCNIIYIFFNVVLSIAPSWPLLSIWDGVTVSTVQFRVLKCLTLKAVFQILHETWKHPECKHLHVRMKLQANNMSDFLPAKLLR